MQALSGNPIHSDLLDPGAEAAMGHIELARWSDIIVIAPCTADSIAKLALGRGDDLLSAVALSTDAPIFVAPAMNQAMWRDGATQNNISTLAEKNFIFIGPDIGTQACGDTGPGRMTEPSDIIQQVSLNFSKGLLAGKKILITAGPTREMIDPVRFISNRSSGKMGIPIVGLVDTNSDPDSVDYIIPGNDDAIRSISLLARLVSNACLEGAEKATGIRGDGDGPVIVKKSDLDKKEKVDAKTSSDAKEKKQAKEESPAENISEENESVSEQKEPNEVKE